MGEKDLRSKGHSPLFFFLVPSEHSTETAVMNGGGAPEHTGELEPRQDGDAGDDSNEQEVIVIQDTGFNVKIQAPGTEPFDLQVWRLLNPRVTSTKHIHEVPPTYLDHCAFFFF